MGGIQFYFQLYSLKHLLANYCVTSLRCHFSGSSFLFSSSSDSRSESKKCHLVDEGTLKILTCRKKYPMFLHA